MAKLYPETVALLKAELKAHIEKVEGRKVIASVRYQHGKGRYLPVAMDTTKMTWVWKGVYGLHGNQPGPVAFLTGFAGEFAGAKGKIEDLPPVAYGLKVAKTKGLTFKPGRRKTYTAESTANLLIDLYGDLAREGVERGRRAAAEVKTELGLPAFMARYM